MTIKNPPETDLEQVRSTNVHCTSLWQLQTELNQKLTKNCTRFLVSKKHGTTNGVGQGGKSRLCTWSATRAHDNQQQHCVLFDNSTQQYPYNIRSVSMQDIHQSTVQQEEIVKAHLELTRIPTTSPTTDGWPLWVGMTGGPGGWAWWVGLELRSSKALTDVVNREHVQSVQSSCIVRVAHVNILAFGVKI